MAAVVGGAHTLGMAESPTAITDYLYRCCIIGIEELGSLEFALETVVIDGCITLFLG